MKLTIPMQNSETYISQCTELSPAKALNLKSAILVFWLSILFVALQPHPAFGVDESNDVQLALLQQIRRGELSAGQTASILIEFAKSPTGVPSEIIQESSRIAGLSTALGEPLRKQGAEFLIENSSAAGLGLKRLATVLLEPENKNRASLIGLFSFLERAEYLIHSESYAELVALRDEATLDEEKWILEPRITSTLTDAARRSLHEKKPSLTLKHLSQIDPKRLTETHLQLAEDAVLLLQHQLSRPEEINAANIVFQDPHVEALIERLPLESIRSALARTYSSLTLAVLNHTDEATLQRFFGRVFEFRPDPNSENTDLRRAVVDGARTAEARAFALLRTAELENTGELTLLQRIRLTLRGDSGKGSHRILAFGILGLMLLVSAVFIVKILSRFGYIANRVRITPGYRRSSVGTDEYSQVLTVFGLDDSATEKQIKDRYRQLVKEYHPDKVRADNGSGLTEEEAVKRFQTLKEAYERITEIRAGWFGK